jgi:hypothetical protein
MSNKRVIKALRILRDEAPQYFEDVIMADCPSDVGLPADYRKWCGMAEPSTEVIFDYCKKCWKSAMGEMDV